jgi:hypothetical protein
MNDSRHEHRGRCYLGGRISFHPNWPETTCVVRNKSRSGARLVLAEDRCLPNQFDLAISDGREVHKASIAWRSGREVGVLLTLAGAR